MRRAPTYVAAILVGAFSAFPLLWVLITSLKQRGEIFTETPDLWPDSPRSAATRTCCSTRASAARC